MINTLRAPKIFNMSVFDLLGTANIAYYITVYNNDKPRFSTTFFILMIIAVVVHYLLGIKTQLNSTLRLN
jgi:uncharacterized membrane protein